MVPPNFSPEVPGFQVAQVTTDGLAICCFNDGSSDGGAKFWEVAYPRRAQHELQITVRELDENGEPVASPPARTFDIGEDVRSFTIRLTGGSEAHYGVYPRGGPAAPNFARTADNDTHDLGWLIDLAGEELQHDFDKLLPKGESGTDVTLARIHHSFLFTRRPGDHPDRLSPKADNDPLSAASRELGRTNEEIDGLLLATEPGEIIFEFEPAGSMTIESLPYDVTRPRRYEIIIINGDTQDGEVKSGFVKGDLHLFYDLIKVKGVKQDLWAVPRQTGVGSASDGDCNPVTTSVATLQPLIEP
jgi:hypothetical protein